MWSLDQGGSSTSTGDVPDTSTAENHMQACIPQHGLIPFGMLPKGLGDGGWGTLLGSLEVS